MNHPHLSSPETEKTSGAQLIFLLAALLPMAASVAIAQREMTLSTAHGLDVFRAYLEGNAGTIFNARPLMRWILNVASETMGLDALAINLPLQMAAAWLGLAGCLALAAYLTGQLFCGAFAAALAGAWLHFTFGRLGYALSYPYDLPMFAICAWGLYFTLRGWFLPVAVVAIAGSFCKETTLWLIPAWAIARWQRGDVSLARIARETIGLVAAFGAVYLGIRYGQHPAPEHVTQIVTVDPFEGGAFGDKNTSSRLFNNFAELLFRQHGTLLNSVYGPLSIYLLAIALWKHLDPIMRLLFIAALFHFLPILIVGNIHESRIFNEVLPLGAVAVATGFFRWTQGGLTPVRVTSPQ